MTTRGPGSRVTIDGRAGIYIITEVDKETSERARVSWAKDNPNPEPAGGDPDAWVPFSDMKEGA